MYSNNLDDFFIENGNCGTALYMSPEIVNHKPLDSYLDVWAIGITFYILVSGGRHPLYKPEKNFNYKKLIQDISNYNH